MTWLEFIIIIKIINIIGFLNWILSAFSCRKGENTMNTDIFKYDGQRKLSLGRLSTDSRNFDVVKNEALKMTAEYQEKIEIMQEKLYAEAKEGLIIIFQAMDAAGKDSTIKHVMSGINPQGVDVTSFKQPSHEELAHDFLWRIEQHIPRRGHIAIMNRSYYEDVLVVKVHDLQKGYKMPRRCIDMPASDFFHKRYKHIKNYEEYLNDNGYRLLKFFLNISFFKQKERFLQRIDTPDKNWKFSEADLKERKFWNEYQDAYESAVNHTATVSAPWYVVPADQKWFTRYIVSKIIFEELSRIDPQYPEISEAERQKLPEYRKELLRQSGGSLSS